MSGSRHDYKLTVVTLGRWSVGKTSLTRRFVQGKFDEHQFATVGAMHLSKVVEVEGCKVLVEIWDTFFEGHVLSSHRHLRTPHNFCKTH